MDRYELPISEKVYKKLTKSLLGDGFAMFKIQGVSNVLFVLAHGNENGEIDVHGFLCTPNQFLKKAVDELNVKDKGIEIVYTISCHGGTQESCSYKGVEIKSIHSSKQKIEARAMGLIDGDYIFEICC